MYLPKTLLATATLILLSASPITSTPISSPSTNPTDKRSDPSNSFAGTNNYFLHLLLLSDQEPYISHLSTLGLKVLRLWVTGNSDSKPCIKGSKSIQFVPDFENPVGTFNTSVLDRLDDTLALLSKYGIKAIISPHDANVINGANGCDSYCSKYSNKDTFYSSITAKQDYDERIKRIFEYKSPNFDGKKWKDLEEVIFAFDIQNEPLIGADDKLQGNDPDDWICGRAGVMRNYLTLNEGIKIATGGIGGSQYCCDHEFNLLDKALYCGAIDIMSVHGYMSKASDWEYYFGGDKDLLGQVEAAGQGDKRVMVEEWGVQSDWDSFNTEAQVFTDRGVPWVYWQITPGKDETQAGHPTDCAGGYDHFEIGIDSGKGDIGSAVFAANNKVADQYAVKQSDVF